MCGEHPSIASCTVVVSGSSPRVWGTFLGGRSLGGRFRFIPAYVGNISPRPACRRRASVHPRVCGEHGDLSYLRFLLDGSSPRMWGTCAEHGRRHAHPRFIPAYVGNMTSPTPTFRASSVHPRVCGEHVVFWTSCRSSSGSSPRMWGTFPAPNPDSDCSRFIPAYVGNMGRTQGRSAGPPVHPRVCGEHDAVREHIAVADGSSPRMWGTSCSTPAISGQCRFIPAYVGNMNNTLRSMILRPVHPRVCGEHGLRRRGAVSGYGSSPRMWGTLLAQRLAAGRPRFIPAYVGNIARRVRMACSNSVHPRVCGEHSCQPSLFTRSSGSSPRMWGTSAQLALAVGQRRFIPAYVGNIARASGSSPSPAVHPRVCGEHAMRSLPSRSVYGSSPRMWGTWRAQDGGRALRRFIPAYVGNICRASRTARRSAVHPRVCGEHPGNDRAGDSITGSSPRMWGTLERAGAAYASRRFIPAYVGNILDNRQAHMRLPVHPRVCGEHARSIFLSMSATGSSPRMWGT